MRFQARAAVDSPTLLSDSVQITIDAYVFGLSTNSSGFLSEICVSVPVREPQDVLPKFETRSGDQVAPHRLHFPTNPHEEELLDLLQYLESFGHMSFGIRKILWEETIFEWVAENVEERKQLD